MNRLPFSLCILTVFAVVAGLAAPLANGVWADPAPPKTITLTPDGNKMAFATTDVTVQAGQEVTIVFKDTATSPAMQHNVVLRTRP